MRHVSPLWKSYIFLTMPANEAWSNDYVYVLDRTLAARCGCLGPLIMPLKLIIKIGAAGIYCPELCAYTVVLRQHIVHILNATDAYSHRNIVGRCGFASSINMLFTGFQYTMKKNVDFCAFDCIMDNYKLICYLI